MEPPGNPQGTLWEPLEHFRSHLGVKTAQGSQGSQGSVLVVFLLKHSLDSLDLEPPKIPWRTLWEPLKHFRNLLEPIESQGSQGKLKGVNLLGTNRTESKEKYKKTLRYQGNSMEPPGNSQGTLREPLEHFISHLGVKTAQGSQGSQGNVLVVFY